MTGRYRKMTIRFSGIKIDIMNKTAVNDISKILNVRPNRILEKLQTLNISVQSQNELMYINPSDVRILANEYINSKRTSERTQKNAQELLTFLDKGNTDIKSSIMKTSNKIRSKRSKQMKRNDNNIGINSDKYQKEYRTYRIHVLWGAFLKAVSDMLIACVQGLESLYFKFFALFVAIFVQMHHTAVWFFRSAPEGSSSWLAAYGYAIMLDLFILVVTLEGKLSIAKTFAGLTFISNLLYFQFWLNFEGTALDWTSAVSCVIISATIAFIIYSYTEIFVKYRNEKMQLQSN